MVTLAPAHDVQGAGFSLEFPCGLISTRECDSWRDRLDRFRWRDRPDCEACPLAYLLGAGSERSEGATPRNDCYYPSHVARGAEDRIGPGVSVRRRTTRSR
jgi:hypothetical protein